MAIYKNTNSDWYISVDGGSGTIYLDGSLDVTGNITYVSELAVNDAFIIAAANNNGGVSNVGFLATKNANAGSYAGLRFDINANAWQISTSVDANGAPVASYANILTGGGSAFVAGANTQVQFNDGGNFGATANLVFDKATNRLTVGNGSTVLGNVGSAVAYAGNGVALYNNTTNSGGTGLYVVGATTTNDELISLTRARLYSIIF